MPSVSGVGVKLDLRLLGDQIRIVRDRRGTPSTDAERDDLLMAVLDVRVVPVIEIPWPDPPDMGWVLPSLERLLEAGRVRDLLTEGRRYFMRRSVPPETPSSPNPINHSNGATE